MFLSLLLAFLKRDVIKGTTLFYSRGLTYSAQHVDVRFDQIFGSFNKDDVDPLKMKLFVSGITFSIVPSPLYIRFWSEIAMGCLSNRPVISMAMFSRAVFQVAQRVKAGNRGETVA